jgi:hypothetical protein
VTTVPLSVNLANAAYHARTRVGRGLEPGYPAETMVSQVATKRTTKTTAPIASVILSSIPGVFPRALVVHSEGRERWLP